MTAFIIIVGVLLLVNIVFILVSLFLTVFNKESKENKSPRISQLSVAQIVLSRQHMSSRGSLPQVTIFNTFVRVSTGSTPSGITQSFRQKHSNAEDVGKQITS
ncbi:uncharacterized protein LOC114253180 [Bombyx mandarina]|uniref:Uncharacterized protein LOC114253180 n=1 Tax=Bombyx mandarina TaxID=7092 RepID=A0A6J2KNM0_BOMMA|nr:uncharacterized protein LOC114253180 [Bombyx mandarina]